ncbi:MAG: alpha-galactosidase [Victivallales bacterium]|nr:alpha-galactosidase [Victivallales bacterium]
MESFISTLADQLFSAIGGRKEGLTPVLPSFKYKYEPFDVEKWTSAIEKLESNDAYDRFEVCYLSPDRLLTLKLTYTVYANFPVIEWRPELSAPAGADTGLIENFRSFALDWDLWADPDNRWEPYSLGIRRYLGAKTLMDDFRPMPIRLENRYPLNNLVLDTDEGRSSTAWLPFVGVDLDDFYGFNVAVGWSGAWSMNFQLQGNPSKGFRLHADAGMLKTHFRLKAGETIRQPSIFVMLRDNMSVEDAQNLHRRFMLDFHAPHGKDGKPLQAPLCYCVWGGETNADVIRKLDWVQKAHLHFDALWMDAGWYGSDREVASDEFHGSDWSRTVGNWRVNQVPHPGGLSPIAVRAHEAGMKYMLWVEMERAMPDSPIVQEHPNWFLAANGSDRLMLNLGIPAARAWAVETISRLVREEKIDFYREDFNFNILPICEQADKEDRQGITEAKFITGFYEFWDELRTRFPDMMIDNCASGGRRIDFETASRSICMFRSDIIGRSFLDSSEAQQNELCWLGQWVPHQAGNISVQSNDDYQFLSAAAPGIAISCAYDLAKLDADWLQNMLYIAERMRPLAYGNLHILAGGDDIDAPWLVYQMDNPETDEGYIAAFRRPDASEATCAIAPRGIEPRAKYILEPTNGKPTEIKGSELAKLTVKLPKPRSAVVFFYTRANARKNS